MIVTYRRIRQIVMAISLMAISMILSSYPATPRVNAQSERSLKFIENVGQFSEGDPARFLVNAGSLTLRLTEEALWITVIDPPEAGASTGSEAGITGLEADGEPRQGVNLKLSFVQANAEARLEPFNRLSERITFLQGSDPARWQPEVPVWGGVRYVDLYPGIDLEISGDQGRLVQRLIVKENELATAQDANLFDKIRLRVDGADEVSLNEAGRLQLNTPLGDLTLPLLQISDESSRPIEPAAVQPKITAGNEVRAPFMTETGPLSPVSSTALSDLQYSTLLGGEGFFDEAYGITFDSEGHAYVTGEAYLDFPSTPGAFDPTSNGDAGDVFIAKMRQDGSGLVYATFLGGSDADIGRAIVVDEAGDAYVTGNTSSTDFPTTAGSFDDSLGGPTDAFVTRLNAAGTALVYSTHLGGESGDFGWDLAIDGSGHVYAAGTTSSSDFPVTPEALDQSNDFIKAYVAKFSPDGSDLIYATYVGGSKGDQGYGLAVDDLGYAYVTGSTVSDDFPVTAGAFDTTYDDIEAYVAKLTPDGSALAYATYLGGSDRDIGDAVALDEAGHAYIVGFTESADFPTTPDAFDTVCSDCDGTTSRSDAFVAKLAGDGSALVYASFLGGDSTDYGNDIAVSPAGSIYVTGYTLSDDFPTTPNALATVCQSCSQSISRPDAYITRIDPSGTSLAYSTFLGGSDGSDRSQALAVDELGNVYVAGGTASPNFPVTDGAFDTTLEGIFDVFVSKLATGPDEPQQEPPPDPIPAHTCAPAGLGQVTVGSHPRGIAVDSGRERAYVANYGSNTLSVIDTGTNTVLQTITGLASANGVAYDSTNNRIWVTNYDLDQVTPVQANDDATAFTVLPAIGTGDGPWGVAYEPARNRVYVVNQLADSVSVIDAETQSVVATVTGSFAQPFHLAANPVTGKVYVANFGHNSVTVIEDTAVSRTVQLWDSGRPYGITVDEMRDLVYVATIQTNRIVAIGPLNGQDDQFLGWASFQRGYNRQRPVPLRAIAVNPEIGSIFDGGHIWATTATLDGSEADQLLFIPKGWSSRFHVPFTQDVSLEPSEGIAIDRVTNRVYVTSGTTSGVVTVSGDHSTICSGITPAALPGDDDQIDLETFSVADLTRSDVTGDREVNIFDLTFVTARYGGNDPLADLNDDGTVDIFDLTLVAGNFGRRLAEGF